MSNLPDTLRGWRGQLAYIDAAHRVHARVEDAIRTGKDCGIGKFPSHDFAVNSAWLTASLTAATLLAWLKLLALDGDLAKAEPKTLRYRILHAAARLTRSSRRRSSNPRDLALGRRHRNRLGPDHCPAASPLTSGTVPATKEGQPRGPWNPRPLASTGPCHTGTIKSRSTRRSAARPDKA